MSRLRRDRHALKVARYVKRCDELTGITYTGTGRWGMASYRAARWMYDRKVWGKKNEDRLMDEVHKIFYGKPWR